MKIGDLVETAEGLGASANWWEPRTAVGVIVAVTGAEPVGAGVRIAWTNGRKDWMKPRWVKPYEGYAGKKHNDIK